MVLENLTLFEVHLDNARIGPSIDDEDNPETDAPTADETTDGDGCASSVGRLVVASVVVSIVVSLIARKLAGDDTEPDVAIDAPEESDAVDVATED
ncbi:hypothetical protein Huta_1054 [Halorhabdus utahensis DSM 12940]|uniref:Uncharacterized protein n=1 Tax=Halorhabdus utahensis (strain DSM 12940 / JCM 11049 / AX-2) TaxID=519442 RepID=C7NVF3_HALUD|nr:hypothetical protein [Halorhabdus utahensis]ACV11237.1 hypothetical protein Huta_1054 [Halorhabdus utahensis DSM 12940]